VVVLSVNSAWNVANFRAGLVRGLQNAGYHVVVLAPVDRHAARVRALGCDVIDLPMNAKGINPFADLLLLRRYWVLLRRLRPAAFLGFTIKPNIYGSLAAATLGVPVVNNIAGLGTTFLRTGWLNQVAKTLYRLALSRSSCVLFQNEDDRTLFEQSDLVARARTRLLPGSGVDLARFAPSAVHSASRRPVFLMSARLLWDKGVREYIEAARILKRRGIECDVRLLGFLDVANPSAVPREEVEAWQQEGVVTYLGETDDVRPMLVDADVAVLPSYREGTPRSLLEAAAMGKPLITTDAPGCRDVVTEGVNGFLVPVRNAAALSEAMTRYIALPPAARIEMGIASRQLAEARYDERLVIKVYLDVLANIVSGESNSPSSRR
jgi:glycosyltransferase involved in cell wall biosynthesis